MAQTAIVTGAGSGIGRATARALLASGWRVALLGRTRSSLEESVQGHTGDSLILRCDVTDASAVDSAFGQVIDRWGRLDLLFNNAGHGLAAATPDAVDPQDFAQVIAVNVTGMFHCARAAFAIMRAQDPRGGRIINNGSISAHVPRPGSIAYTASKHAVTGMTRSLSLDGRRFDIACGQIDVGNASTELLSQVMERNPEAEPMIDVAIVAQSVLHMASLPLGANVQFMTVMATAMPYIGRG